MADKTMSFRPRGRAENIGKTTRSQRLKRGQQHLHKVFPPCVTHRFNHFIAHHFGHCKVVKRHAALVRGPSMFLALGPRSWAIHSLTTQEYANEHFGYVEALNPPNREGESAFFLFDWLGDASSFRRQVQKVKRARSNDMRGEIVDVMKIRAAEFTIHPDAIQFFSGKAQHIQTKQYQALTGPGFASLQDRVLRC